MARRSRRCTVSPRAIRSSTPMRARCSTSKRASSTAARDASRRRRWRASRTTCLRSPRSSLINRAECRSQSSIDGPARAAFERGREFYARRHGQMNLACTHCHDQNWGKRLLGETISQGHGTGFPAYRLEWQALGSLQRRLRACLFGIRAEMPPRGRAGAHRPRALSRMARAGAADRDAGRSPLVCRLGGSEHAFTRPPGATRATLKRHSFSA